MKKFELTTDFITVFGIKLFRIKALVSFGNVKEGELGGYIEKENNLSQEGSAWVSGNAMVTGNAWVSGDALVTGNALVTGDSRVTGYSMVTGYSRVSGNAWVTGDSRVSGNAMVTGYSRVSGNAWVSGDALVSGNADYATVKGFGSVYRNATFFRTEEKKVKVVCGCFYGTLEEFRKKVKETHGESKIAKEYLMVADLMEYHFEEK